jgi:hypothetical protein
MAFGTDCLRNPIGPIKGLEEWVWERGQLTPGFLSQELLHQSKV